MLFGPEAVQLALTAHAGASTADATLPRVKTLLAAIREACSAGTWSRGVELARSGAVVGEADEGDEIVLRVRLKGAVASPQVVLFPDDDDWTCECNFREDACPHVAAAAIALKQARNEGKPLPGVDEGGVPPHIAYRLEGLGKKLVLRRVLATDGSEDEGIRGSLAQLSQGGTAGILVTGADLSFEKRFGTVIGGVITRERMEDVLHALKEVDDVTLDREKIEIGGATSGLCARLHDVGDDIRVVLEQDPSVKMIYENGAIVREGKIHAFAPHGLRESDFRRFRDGAIFGPGERGTVAGDVLPRLRRHLPVIIETDRLPKARTIKPRLHIATARQGNNLEVFPTIVYGDPPVARVDGDRLTLLGEGEAAPVRNFELEKRLQRQLRDGLGLEAGNRRKMATDEALAWTKRAGRLDDVGYKGDAHTEFFEAGPLQPHLDRGDNGQPDLWFGTDDGGGDGKQGSGGRVEAAAIMAAWENNEDLVPLLSGGFGRVPADWLSKNGHRVLALLAAKEAAADERELPAWAWADVAAVAEALEQPPPPELQQLRGILDDFSGVGEPELPEDLTATLRDYQRHGVAWLGFLRKTHLGALLADDMGLGKTLQALCSIRGKTLVVAPTSVIPNWAKEAAKFRPSLTTSVYHGAGRELNDADITLTTYALLRLDLDKLSAVQWDTVVLDESQAIKNPDSQVARAAFAVPAKWRIAMTGTPVENRLDDLWSQFHFLSPGFLGGRTEFQRRFVKPIAAGDDTTAATLRSRIRPFVLRRLKREVAKELPPRTDVNLYCELRPDERAVYDTVRAAMASDIAKRLGAGDSVMKILEALLRLRQAACHPSLIPGKTEAPAPDSSKLALLAERIEECVAEGHKALVFSQWTSLLDLVQPVLDAIEVPYNRLDGSTSDRGKVVDAFQDPQGPPVMLISLRAGGTGLNLTAADHVFLLDPWWNPAVEDQAADRAHRIGQDNPVFVHRLVARDTVEERILALQERKRQLAEAAVGEASQATQISRDELAALLE